MGQTTTVFIDLDSTASAHYTLASPKVFAGDFEVHVDFSTTITSGNGTLFSGSTQSEDSIVCDIQSNGAIRFFAFAGTSLQTVITGSITGLNDGRLHTVILRYVGTTASITVNGVLDSSNTWALTGSEDVGNFGIRENGTNKFDGIEANVKLIDITTPANSQYYKLNLLTGNTETSNSNTLTYQNIATGARDTYALSSDGSEWLGSDLITQAVWENPSGIDSAIYTYEAATNTWLMTGDGGFQSLSFLATSNQPESMVVKGYVELISGSGWVAFQSGSTTFGEGLYEESGNKSDNTSQGFKRSSGVVNARFSKYSLQAKIGIA
jgi:hypothetical protein